MFILAVVFIFQQAIYSESIAVLVDRVVENSPSVQAKEHKLKVADAEYASSISSAFPAVNFNNNYSEQKNPFGSSFFIGSIKNYTSVFQVQQPLYLGGRIWAGMEIKKQAKQVVALSVNLEKQMVVRNFLSSYFQVLSLIDKKSSLQNSLKTQKQFVKLTNSKLKRGSARAYEAYQAEAELASYESRLRQIVSQITSLKQALQEDLKQDKLSDFSYPSEFIKVSSDKSKLQNELLQNNVQIRLAKQQVDVSEAQKDLDAGVHLPNLNLEAQVGWRSPTTSGLFEESNKSHTYIVNFSIPIFSGLSSVHTRKASSERIMQQKKQLQTSQLAATKQFYQSFESYKNSSDVYKKTKVWQSEAAKAVRNGLKNFKSGIISNFQVVQLQKGLEAAESALADATATYHMSVVELYFVLGRDLLSLYK